MNEGFLEEENRIAEERDRAEARDILALQQPIGGLSELQPVVSVSPDTTTAVAVSTLVERRVGCLLVMQDHDLLGLFTERDVLLKVAASGADSSTPVSTYMTTNPDTLHIDSPLVYALHRMSVGGYRHVPLLNDDGHPVAVVSMRDIVEYIVSLFPNEVLNLPDQPHQTQWRGRDGA